jgi:hypothetical protein
VNPDTKGKMISLATETERTLFFDFLPIDLGEVRGFKTPSCVSKLVIKALA